ncbi:universal stress protein [Streptomyces sp. cg36]|uniref:universal stress protein n=1 Tax=Streptomyces sp. cg36 TaxID=3238798 RepID=UPI0034E2891D
MKQAIKRIVVGVDGSEHDVAVLRAAENEARRRRADLCPVLVFDCSTQVPAHRHDPAHDVHERFCHDEAMETLSHICDQAIGRGGDAPVVTPAVVPDQDAARALVGQASRTGDLLIVGAGKHGTLHRLLYGSLDRYCRKNAPCPVIVVPQTNGKRAH